MRILYLHQYFVTPDRPGGTRSYEMARRWAHKHEVHIITTDREPDDRYRGWRSTNVDGIAVSACAVPYSNTMGFRERMRAFAHFALQAGARAVELGGDVVFATSTPLTIAWPAVRAARRLEIPMVFEVRDLWPQLPIAVGALRNPLLIPLARRLERYAYANARRVVALSPDMARGVAAAGYPPDRIAVVPNCADNDWFERNAGGEREPLKGLPGSPDYPLVVYCGTLGQINGVTYLVELAGEAKRRGAGVRFLIVGSGKEMKAVEERARTLGVLGRNLWMRPPVAKQQVPGLLASASACCSLVRNVPELWANSANKFFDALAAGRPVIVNYGGWQADLIRGHDCGLVLDPGDFRRAADDLLSFLGDPQRVEAAGRKAKALAVSQFDRDELARRLLSVIEDAVAEQH